MRRNKISDLNDILMAAIEELMDPEIIITEDNPEGKQNEPDLEKYKTLALMSKQVIEIKKTEIKQAQLLIRMGYSPESLLADQPEIKRLD